MHQKDLEKHINVMPVTNYNKMHDKITYKISKKVSEVDPFKAYKMQQEGSLLIDIREQSELYLGKPLNSTHIPKSQLEITLLNVINDLDVSLLIICSSGKRSLFAAYILKELGFKNVFSVSGGFENWKNSELPYSIPEKDKPNRYIRQILIPEIGKIGQQKINKSKILIIGMGGIGCPAALYLAAAGIGHIGIIDNDLVDLNNLHRQILYSEKDIGKSKVLSAKDKLEQLNSEITIMPYEVRINSENINSIILNYDMVLDATDNFETRNVINNACIRHKKPNIQSSVFLFEGQISTFHPNFSTNAPCYRCLYSEFPPAFLSPSCSEIGVLGILPGLMGVLAATEALKIILDIKTNLIGKLLVLDLLEMDFSVYNIQKNKNCNYCSSIKNTDH
ncbi:MAG: molybdopterin-synthase adenylyltransferase MoeB [Bacteroidales bacterium]|nr:molybdopterin-synthase adenylyltransferase MoeB [Bacteroidales bacterium]